MNRTVIPINTEHDILPEWHGTPISDLLVYHNLNREHRRYDSAEMVIVCCMDPRKVLRIPDKFAYILRTGGGNPGRVQFEISFAVAVGGARAIAIIAHDDCGMDGLDDQRDKFIHGLVGAGWKHEDAQLHFDTNAPDFGTTDTVEYICTATHRMKELYPNITIAPLFYSIEDGRLHQIQ